MAQQIYVQVYQKNDNVLLNPNRSLPENGITFCFPTDGFFAEPAYILVNGVQMNSVIKVIPTALNQPSDSYYTTLTVGEINNLSNLLNTPVAQSFNPLFTDASGTTAGAVATGSYTMISPKICFFRVYVDFASCTNFGTLQYQITLPFPSVQTMRQAGGTLHQTTGSALYHIAGITDIASSSTIHKLYYSGSTTDLGWKYNTPVGGTTVTSHFDLSGVYQIV